MESVPSQPSTRWFPIPSSEPARCVPAAHKTPPNADCDLRRSSPAGVRPDPSADRATRAHRECRASTRRALYRSRADPASRPVPARSRESRCAAIRHASAAPRGRPHRGTHTDWRSSIRAQTAMAPEYRPQGSGCCRRLIPRRTPRSPSRSIASCSTSCITSRTSG